MEAFYHQFEITPPEVVEVVPDPVVGLAISMGDGTQCRPGSRVFTCLTCLIARRIRIQKDVRESLALIVAQQSSMAFAETV
jgi:hypothetical protein